MNSHVVFDLSTRKISGYVSHIRSLNGISPNWTTQQEADITNTTPAALLTHLSGLHKQDFLPRPTPDDELRAQWTKERLPTWGVKLFTSTLYNKVLVPNPNPNIPRNNNTNNNTNTNTNTIGTTNSNNNIPGNTNNGPNASSTNPSNPTPIHSQPDLLQQNHIHNEFGFHLSRRNWFLSGSFAPASQEIHASFGLELWRNGAIANGILRWRVPPDLYALTGSGMFWKELPELQYFVHGIRLTQPGIRYIDLTDHNGNIVRRIDITQSHPQRFAYVDNHHRKAKDPNAVPATFEYEENCALPNNDNVVVFRKHILSGDQDHGGDGDDNDHNHDVLTTPRVLETMNATGSNLYLHTPLSNQEKQHRIKYGKPDQVKSGFLPLLEYLNTHILSSISKQSHAIYDTYVNNNDNIEEYLNYIYQLNAYLQNQTPPPQQDDDTDEDFVRGDHVEDYDATEEEQQHIIAIQDDPILQFDPTSQNDTLWGLKDVSITVPKTSSPYTTLATSTTVPKTTTTTTTTTTTKTTSSLSVEQQIAKQISTILNALPLPDFSSTPIPSQGGATYPHDEYEVIPNNGDPFDMSNITDRDILRLPRSDTPYVFHPDPFLIDGGYTGLLHTAKLLQLPAVFNYLNLYAKIHYYYVPPSVLNSMSTVYKHVKSGGAASSRGGHKQQQQQQQQQQSQFGKDGEHRVSVSAHLHSVNDRFHLIVAGSPSDHVYTARMAFVVNGADHSAPTTSPHNKTSQDPTDAPGATSSGLTSAIEEFILPEVYYLDDSQQYERRTNLENRSKHIFGLQGLLYPSIIPRGYNVNHRAQQVLEADPAKRPKLEHTNFITQNPHLAPPPHTSSYATSLTNLISPLNLIRRAHPAVYDWAVSKNIQHSVEFQYAYIKPFEFDFTTTMSGACAVVDDGITTGLDKYREYVLKQVEEHHQSFENGGDEDDVQDDVVVVDLDRTRFTGCTTAYKQLSVVGVKAMKYAYTYLPFLSQNTAPSQQQQQQPNPTPQTTTTENQPSQQQQQQPTQPPTTLPHPTLNPIHTMLFDKIYHKQLRNRYQQKFTLGVNVNTNGHMQGYADLDLTSNWTVSMSLSADASKSPDGAVRPLKPHSPVSIGFGLNYTPRD